MIPPLALVYVAPTLITEVMGNVSGGMRQGAIFDGVLNMGLDIDLERLTNWWTGGSIHVNSLWGSFSVAPWWTIQPDFQYIWTPSAQNGSNNAAVIGIRTVVTF